MQLSQYGKRGLNIRHLTSDIKHFLQQHKTPVAIL